MNGIPDAVVALTGLAIGLPVVYVVLVRYRLPAQCRALLQRMLDPTAGPPASAEPTRLDAAERWAVALTNRDWRAAADLLDDDFRLLNPVRERKHNARVYVRSIRRMFLAFPDLHLQVDEVVAEQAAPEVAWVRFSETGRPRRGAPIEATWWERWTLDPHGERVREVALAGVTRLA